MPITEKDIEGTKEFIRNIVNDSLTEGVVIGLSGGIDSALTAKLCVDALGLDKVYCVSLPCDSNPDDEVDAKLVAEWLGAELHRLDLGNSFTNLASAIQYPRREKSPPSFKRLTFANMKSRLRMVALYTIANEYNLLVVGTTNKSEWAVGYATKYGDGGVDVEPIQDFFKTEVWEMSLMVGVPQKIIDRIPTAGLWDGQTDEAELGMDYYDLDAVLRTTIFSHNPTSSELDHFDDRLKVIERVKDLWYKSAHKRKSPPHYKRPTDDGNDFLSFD